MYPHTATAWTKGSEEGRKAAWSRTALTECRWSGTEGAQPGSDGDSSAFRCSLIVRTPDGSATGLSRGDRVSFGESPEETPPASALTVRTVKAVRIGGTVHHEEVDAR